MSIERLNVMKPTHRKDTPFCCVYAEMGELEPRVDKISQSASYEKGRERLIEFCKGTGCCFRSR